ncbi:MAG: hypothetical protein RLZZ196_95 [Bacteroidota bacterium]|jgi:hypothetical protein
MICDYEECNNQFEPRTHNQKYCSDECCKIATNLKIKEKYYYKKARASGVKFTCKNRGCSQILSKFTTDLICENCKAKQRTKDRKEIMDILNGN